MALTLLQRREARNFARSFAAGLVQSAEVGFQGHLSGLSDEQEEEATAELQRIAKRIEGMKVPNDKIEQPPNGGEGVKL